MRTLKEGEVIKAGDEVETSNSFHDEPKWEKAGKRSIGKRAPSPLYPAHRIYRRPSWLSRKRDQFIDWLADWLDKSWTEKGSEVR